MTGRTLTPGTSHDADDPGTDDVEITAGELDEALSGEQDDDDQGATDRRSGPSVAGVALIAADTGRVLMIQRALDDGDEAAGTWEFPGGHIEDGDTSDVHGAIREWSEEVGQPFPSGASHAHQWDAPGGVYRGHVFVIPAESMLDLAAERTVHNPDDDSEQVAWWDPADARRNPALRKECRRTPWGRLASVAADQAESKAAAHDPWDDELRDPGAAVEVKDQQPGRQPVANTGRPEGPAWASQTSGAPASVADAKKGSSKKRKVASKAGENRYGLPIGTELGKARDKNAEGAQKDKRGQDLYEQLRKTDPAKYKEMLDKLNPDDLQKLSRLLFSARSSNAAVVAARIAVANAMRRRGLDVNKTGGGLAGPGPARPPAAPKPGGKAGDKIKGNTVDEGQIPDAVWDQLLREGWKGRAGDGAERLYRPGTKGVDHMQTEHKGATTSTASGKRKAENAGKTIKDEDGDEAAYPIRTIGDVASALKKAKQISDPDRKRKVMSHIRTGAGKINAGHMVPKTDNADKGTGKGSGSGKGPPDFIKKKIDGKKSSGVDREFTDLAATAAAVDAKVMSPNPNATRLREYWAHGEGRAKWAPGTPGDFERLKAQVKKYIPKHMLNGFVANVHKLATGEWPGRNAHGGKSGEPDGVETNVITASELKFVLGSTDDDADADPEFGDDDGVTLALDAYSDMADTLTSDEEYEQSLADQVDWDLGADGTLTESDWEPERGHARPSAAPDIEDGGDYDPSDMLAELASADAD